MLHELLEGPQYLHHLLDVRVAHQLTGLHCFHQAHHSVKFEKLKSKCAIFRCQVEITDSLRLGLYILTPQGVVSLLSSDGRRESNTENVSIPELASVLLRDVAKLGIPTSCSWTYFSIFEGVTIRVVHIPLRTHR